MALATIAQPIQRENTARPPSESFRIFSPYVSVRAISDLKSRTQSTPGFRGWVNQNPPPAAAGRHSPIRRQKCPGNVGFVLLSFGHAQLAAAPWRHALASRLWLDSQMRKRVKRAPVDSLCRKAKPTEIRAFSAQPKGWWPCPCQPFGWLAGGPRPAGTSPSRISRRGRRHTAKGPGKLPSPFATANACVRRRRVAESVAGAPPGPCRAGPPRCAASAARRRRA